MSSILESLGQLFSPLGTNVGLKNMFERCLAARTKAEEKWLVQDCLQIVRKKLSEPTTKAPITTKCLLFAIFSEMLGYRTEFAYIHAAKLAQQGTLIEKKVGYLACAVLLRPSDPLSVLLVNTIVRDLTSRNIVVVAMALTACCHLLLVDQLPTLLPLVVEKLNHSNEYIRGKAVVVMHHFLRLCHEQCCHYISQVQCLLGDKNPGVVTLVLQYLLDVVQSSPNTLEDIVPALAQIQRQILEGKLPRDYTYKEIPAPWMQISILRLLRFAGSGTSNLDVQSVVYDTLTAARKHNSGEEVQGAIICECIVTLAKTETNETRLTTAVDLVSQFLSSNNINLRYEGLNVLENILHNSAVNLTAHQQGVIMENLQHIDPSMKRKTLSLLCSMATESKARTICTQVADYAMTECVNNAYLRNDMVNKAILLVDKYPDLQNYWHVAMLIRLLPLAEGQQNDTILTKFKLSLIAGNDNAYRTAARQKVLKLLKRYSESKTACTSILEAYVWSLGRFFDINIDGDGEENTAAKSLNQICQLGLKVVKNLKDEHEQPHQVSNLLVYIVQAAAYTAENSGVSVKLLPELLQKITSSSIRNALLSDCCSELIQTLPHLESVYKALKSCRHLRDSLEDGSEFDFTLSFLDGFVCESLESGEDPYWPQTEPLFQPLANYPESSNPVVLPHSPSVPPNPRTPSMGSESVSELVSSTSSQLEDSKPWLLLSESKHIPKIWTAQGRISEDKITKKHIDAANETGGEVSSDNNSLKDLLFGPEKDMAVSLKSTKEVAPHDVTPSPSHEDLFEDLLGQNFQKLSVSPPIEKS